MSDLTEGDEFAGHRIEGVAGRGGMGVVYRARQLDLDRVVALKLIAPSLAQDEAFRTRFIAESRAAAAIDHPNVIPVYYAGESDGRLYIAMRFVDGEDLRSRVRREGRLAPEPAAHVVAQVAAALDAAHARGLVHRDVKPANVLLGAEDHVYLTDFGLTRSIDSAGGATRTGGWVGTLGFVAPEQIRGERTDARSDVYALGCLLYHALTGSTPFRRDGDEATLWAHLHDPPPSVVAAAPDVPPAFEAVVRRALAKDPAERYASAGDLGRAALAAAGRAVPATPRAPIGPDEDTVASTDPPTAIVAATRRREPPAAAPAPIRRRPRVAVLVAGVLAAIAVAGTAIALLSNGGGAAAPRRTPPNPAGVLATTASAQLRPNAIVATRTYVWTLAGSAGRATLLSTATGRSAARAPAVGRGATAIAAEFGRVWIVKESTRSLLAYGITDARRAGPPIPLGPGRPVAIAAGGGAVWVGSRATSGTAAAQAAITKVAPDTGALTRVPLAHGLQNLAVGDGGVWVIDARRVGVVRYDIRTGRPGPLVPTGSGAYAVTVGGGAVWVANQTANTVTRVDPRTRATTQIPVGRSPLGIAAGVHAVWVANTLDGTMTRIDPRSARVVGRPVRVGGQPFAVAVRDRSAWVTLLRDGAVARVEFR